MIIRPATIEDLKDVYEWRNDELSMAMSLNQNKISFNSHSSWFENKIQSDDALMFIIEINNNKTSVVRFEKHNDSAEISINLNPDYRGKGYAAKMLELSEIEMRKLWNIEKIIAKIKKNNIQSTKIFERCNFGLISSDSGVLTYEK